MNIKLNSKNKIFQGIFLILLLLLICPTKGISTRVQISPTTINEASTLSLLVTPASSVPANGRLILTLPSQMSVSTSSTLSCTFIEPNTIGSVTCSSSGRVITITLGSTGLSATFFQLDISKVVNPPSTTTTSSFSFQTQNSAGTTIESQTSGIVLKASAGSLSSVSLTTSSNVVGASNTLTVTIVITNAVLASGKISLTLPKWNVNAIVEDDILSMLETTFSVTAGTNLNQASMSSSLSIGTGTASDTLTINGAVPSTIAGGSTISFSVSGFLNPISSSTYSGFTVKTLDSSDGEIDSGSNTLRVTTPATIYDTNFNYKTDTSTNVVQALAVLRLQFKVPVPINSGCVIEVTFPDDLPLSGTDLTNVQGLGFFGGSRALTGSVNVGNNTYTISDGCTTYISQDILAILDFSSIENPFTVKPTGTVEIYVKDSNQFSIAQITSGITYSATEGTLTNLSLTPELTTVSSTTGITITFLPEHELTADNVEIVVTLPSDVSITNQASSATCTLTDIQNMSPSMTCTVISNVITLIDPFDVYYIPTSTEILSFSVNGMVMPPSLKPPGDVLITTRIQNSTQYYNVDTVSGSNLFVSSLGSMTDASAVATSTLTYITTTYTFSFKPLHAVLKGGFVRVTLPTQVSIPDTTTSATSCTAVAGYNSAITCSISSSTITVSGGFPSSNFAAGGTLTFSINGILNPVSTSTTDSFTYTTYDSSNYQIDQRTSGITVAMQTTGNLNRVTLSTNSTVNSAAATYTFTIEASSPLVDGDQIYIKVPDEITPPTTPTCVGKTKLSSSLACNILNKEIYVTLSFGSATKIDPNTEFSFSISTFTNPSSTKETSDFAFQALDSDDFLINSQSSTTTVTLTTNTPDTITVASVSNDNQDASQSATFTVKFTTVNEIPTYESSSLNYIMFTITYPPQVEPFDSTVATITCSLNIATSPECKHDSVNRLITVTGVITSTFLVANTQVEVVLNEMKNPSAATGTSSFSIQTYQVVSTNNYAIDRVNTGLTLTVNCDYPCLTCGTTQKDQCQSCLADSSGTQLLLQDNDCVTDCDEDYANINSVCTPCEANCGACLATNLASCTKCGKSAAKFLINTRCTNSCPAGTYGNSTTNTCEDCDFPCETCNGAANVCLTCEDFDINGNPSTLTLLDGTNCVASCTSGTSVNVNGVCTDCSTNCDTCEDEIDTCTSCASPLILDKSDNSCKGTCPRGITLYSFTSNACELCNTNCATCAGTVDTCVTCDDGLLLTTADTCATSCLTTAEYVNDDDHCVECATGCLSCDGSATYCDRCNTNSGYLFANFTCVTDCPDDFTLDLDDDTRCVLDGLVCPFGYEIDESGTDCEPSLVVCDPGYKVNDERTKCIPEPGGVIYFPFFIIFIIMFCVIMIGYCRNKNQMITTCLIKAIAIIETPMLIVQIWSAAYISSYGILAGTIIALILLILLNISFCLVYYISVVKDSTFKHWRDKFKKSSTTVAIISLILNFKFYRCFYSRFFGLAMFYAPFDKSTLFYRPFIIMNIIYLLLVIIPIIIVDIVAFFFIEWGYQLLIVAIESFLFSLLVIILSLIEFWKIKSRFFHDEDDSYLAINPKMFDNAYTVAGGVPNNETHNRVMTMSKNIKGRMIDDSENSNVHNSYSYNAQMKYEDVTNLSSIGFMSRFNSSKQIVDQETKDRRYSLQNIIGKLHKKNPLRTPVHVDVMSFENNRIFRKRRDYEENNKLREEDDFDHYDRKFMRRCQSFEDLREIDEAFAPDKRELIEGKCISYPPSPREMEKIEHYLFSDQVDEIRDKLKAEFSYNNLYADASDDYFDPEAEYNKLRARRIQTYGKDFHRFDFKQEEEELKGEADFDADYAQSILDGVIGNLSDDDARNDDQLVRRTKRERMALAKKRKMQIPNFAIEDIMGEFDIDDQGNYVILRNDDTGDLEDRNGRRVNSRGYLIDKWNNVIDKFGNLIFKDKELDSDDEIPPPYSFEKRKKQLLNKEPDKIEKFGKVGIPPEDDGHVWADPKGKDLADTMSGDETPVESLMGESPGRYLQEKKNKRIPPNRNKVKTIQDDHVNIDLDSQKETLKYGSTAHPESIKSSRKTKRLTSARVKGPKGIQGADAMIDGFVKDLPFYFNGMPNVHDSLRGTPKTNKRRLKRKGPHNDSLKRIYGNIDPFLYKNDSKGSGVRLDKVVNLKDRRHENIRLADSAEIDGRLNMANTDEDLDSDMYRNSRLERIPSKYKDRSTLGDTSMKSKLNDLEDIYHNKTNKREFDSVGRKTQYNSRLAKIGQKNTHTITRNMFTADSSSLGGSKNRVKKFKDSRPSMDYARKPRGIEEGGWV